MILLIILFILSLMISWMVIRIGIPLSYSFGIADRPGGHKGHDTITPFVGGLGIFIAFIIGINLSNDLQTPIDISSLCMQLSALIIFLTGFVDDIWQLDYKVRFLIQTVVAMAMALWGGVLLIDLGSLLSTQPFELGMLALPLTVFGTIGVINALNMIDGLDGLSGSVSFVSLFLIAIVAFIAGENAHLALMMVLMGGVAGFLYFNLRWGTRKRAAVFLGDNGSMLLGFLFSWVLIDMSQGENRAMTPVTGLWILAVPLMDAVGVIIRRIYFRQSPFKPDRNHLHHLLIRSGFRTQDIVYIISMIQLVLGCIGLIGLYAGIPESLMLISFIGLFLGYCYVIARPWRFVPTLRRLHTQTGLISRDCRGVYVGGFPVQGSQYFIETLLRELQSRYPLDLYAHETKWEKHDGRFLYATIPLFLTEDDVSTQEVQSLILRLKALFKRHESVEIRQYIDRDHRHDRRVGNKSITEELRNKDRRSKHNSVLICKIFNNNSPAQTLEQAANPV